MDSNLTHNSLFLDAYRNHTKAEWLRFSVYSAWLAVTLVPGFAILDYLIYPEHFIRFLLLRVSCTAAIGVLAFIGVKFFQRQIKRLTIFGYFMIQLMICYMIVITDGPNSPYYAGLNIALIGMGFFLPTALLETLLFSLITLLLYEGSVFVSDYQEISRNFFGNNFFLVSTCLIATVSSFFLEKRRYNEFLLSYQLEQRNEELDELNRQRTHFFSNVSHELRTPLTLILAPLQDVLDEAHDLPALVLERLAMVRDNAFRLLKLVNDLLDIIKLEEGKEKMEYAPLDVNSVLSGLVYSMEHLARSKGVALTWKTDGTVLTVRGDLRAVEKIFVNLINNAIKFTKSGGAVTVESRLDNDEVCIHVRDTGIGIETSEQIHIFDRFHQVDTSSTRPYGGTGLGLALVKELTEQMKGWIEVDSMIGKGTCVSVRFPISNDPASYQPASEDGTEDAIQAIHRLAELRGGLTIEGVDYSRKLDCASAPDHPKLLIVEDEPDMRRYLVDLLERDYCVLPARSGTDGLKVALEEEPELVLLDLMLPEMDGLEVCHRIRDSGIEAGPKIILLTARTDEESRISALRHGADDFLTKPFSSVEVKTRLKNLLAAVSLERRLADRNKTLEAALKALRHTQKQLVQSEKLNALGSLAAGLLHEINNPLNYSLTALQLIRGDASVRDNEMVQEVVGDIDEGMQRIRAIVSDLRAFAYPSEAEKCSPFDFKEALESALRFTSHELAEIKVESDLTQGSIVMGSKNHITQVLVNLLVNAARAIKDIREERRGEIHVTGEIRDARLAVTVADNGVGMNEETLDRVFDPFFTTRDVGEGMGLGLSVCHTIVANHGGQLIARSTAGMGSELEFDLPLARNTQINVDNAQAAVS